ncbi:hypothetical protein BAVI_07566 [Neobacillus vireti LMG 21834]|uniref:Uncharacterized protein n=1 Tax=Neobacillus vireti LMG 21834 TaxID=1131730 RepID=A0AB94IQR2_9BACI|nr:hypothetical protein BAVI_07566 [Neobacillus vireti LMG 21834]
MGRPIQNLLNNLGKGKTSLTPNIAGLTEFSKEFFPNKNPNRKNALALEGIFYKSIYPFLGLWFPG